MSNKPNRPVDMSNEFRENGWEYCKYLITDPRSDHYLSKSNEHSKLETPQQEGEEENT